MRLLLFGNSTNTGEEYLSYTLPYIDSFLQGVERKALFIPYAGISPGFDPYFKMVEKQLNLVSVQLSSVHQFSDKKQAVKEAQVIITGGGNTFCLLKSLQDENLIETIREKLQSGTSYIGWSAGSNLACPTIRTTNDMPVVQPENFNALNLISFQINPHYTDYKQADHAGETREMRINEFILMNRELYVTGLREGTLLQIIDNKIELMGDKPCRIFHYNQAPFEVNPGEKLDFLMQ